MYIKFVREMSKKLCWMTASFAKIAVSKDNRYIKVVRLSSLRTGRFTLQETFLVLIYLTRKQLDALSSQIYSWNETLHVSDSSCVHHQFFTVHTAMVYAIQFMLTACEHDQDGTAVPSWSCSQAVRMEHPDSLWAGSQQTCITYTTAVCTVKNSRWWTRESVRNM